MIISTYKIDKMDCPCEENLIKMKLQDIESILSLHFDLSERRLTVRHQGEQEEIDQALNALKLGTTLLNRSLGDNLTDSSSSTSSSSSAATAAASAAENSRQRKVLWIVLAVNLAFFFIEGVSGIVSKSLGLAADSLDMLADALVYGMSIFAVGATRFRKKRVALVSGYLQIILATIGFSEVIKRILGEPAHLDSNMMIGVASIALIANVICLLLLQRTKSNDAHIKASIIFSSNDIIVNGGVIAAGISTGFFHSTLPDLMIGTVVFIMVMRGAVRILKLSK